MWPFRGSTGVRSSAGPGEAGGAACRQATPKRPGPRGAPLGSGLHPKGRGGALTGESALTSAPGGGLADEGAWGSQA